MIQEEPKFIGLRSMLIDNLKKEGIEDMHVLAAMSTVPRHFFIESAFAEKAYEDIALPIAENQTISQPYTVAYQSQLLQVQPGDKILEIGTGSGYQCAILCEMGAMVFSIERNRVLYQRAKEILTSLGYQANLKHGDGTLGWPQFKPYDGILVTAASPIIPESLKMQLEIGGRLVIPVGDLETQTMKLIIRKSATDFDTYAYGAFKFVPLIGREGWLPES